MSNLKTSSAFSRARYEDLQRDVDARRATLTERRSQLKEAQAELFEFQSVTFEAMKDPYQSGNSARQLKAINVKSFGDAPGGRGNPRGGRAMAPRKWPEGTEALEASRRWEGTLPTASPPDGRSTKAVVEPPGHRALTPSTDRRRCSCDS